MEEGEEQNRVILSTHALSPTLSFPFFPPSLRMEVLRQIQGDSYGDEEEEGREEAAAEYQALFERRREGLAEEGEEEMDEDEEVREKEGHHPCIPPSFVNRLH